MPQSDNSAPPSASEKTDLSPSKPPPPAQPPKSTSSAWLQVFASFLINLNNFGLANSFGVFQAYYETNLLPSSSSSSISWVGTLQVSLILIIGVISGPLFDLGYFYPILIVSSVVLVFALMMLSLATEYYQVILTWGVLGGLCTGLLYIPSVSMIPVYFTKRRGFALGCATAGGSFGGILYPIIVRRMLDTAGFSWACRTIGFVALFSLSLAIILMKPSGAQTTKKPMRQLFDRTIVTDPAFSVFTIASFFMWLGFLLPYILTPLFALRGLRKPADEDLAYYLLAVPNTGQLLGRIIPGLLVDYKVLGPETIVMFNCVVAGALALCWIAVHNIGGLVTILFLYGFFSGAVTTLPAFIIPYLSPSLAVIGTRMGIVYGAAGFGALIGAPVALALDAAVKDHDGDEFLGAQCWNGTTILFASCLCIYPLIEARKRRLKVEAKAKAEAEAAMSATKRK